MTPADTIYRIDKISEEAIVAWFREQWPSAFPVEVVMEGLEESGPLTFPTGTPTDAVAWQCIIDPIDGTRCIMYDKRPGWALLAVAPKPRDRAATLEDIVAACMTELPTSKQWRADQVSAIRGAGLAGVRAEAIHVITGARTPLRMRPSQAVDLHHGFSSVVKFFPDGKEFTARLEERLWSALGGVSGASRPLIFDDQYMSTGGQIHELLSGRDRVVADLRPLVFAKLGLSQSLTCHPYDICTAMILREAGGVVESPGGGPLREPLDTTTPVAWVGYANENLARLVRPRLVTLLRDEGLLG